MTQPAHPINTIASRIGRHHIGRPTNFEARTSEGVQEVAGILRWITHTSDDVLLAVEDADGDALEWMLGLQQEVTVR